MAAPLNKPIPNEALLDDAHAAPSAQEFAVCVENISVAFRSYQERPVTLKEAIIKAIKTGQLRYYSTFDALSNVSFNVRKGEIFGIIGSNGAGKSTLLRALSGVLMPTSGKVHVEGTVDSLIQLGAGFDADLNAIENIYLNGSLHKQSRAEIEKRVPHILEFAELGDFATTPIRYYSSGMSARLGFAAAIDRKPDVLLVDEVLAVGDERFKDKCNKVFDEHLSSGRTIVIVSHGLSMLEKMCSQIAVLSKGKLIFVGDPKEALEIYRDKDYRTALGNRSKQEEV